MMNPGSEDPNTWKTPKERRKKIPVPAEFAPLRVDDVIKLMRQRMAENTTKFDRLDTEFCRQGLSHPRDIQVTTLFFSTFVKPFL